VVVVVGFGLTVVVVGRTVVVVGATVVVVVGFGRTVVVVGISGTVVVVIGFAVLPMGFEHISSAIGVSAAAATAVICGGTSATRICDRRSVNGSHQEFGKPAVLFRELTWIIGTSAGKL
jgi:hypothetical protein